MLKLPRKYTDDKKAYILIASYYAVCPGVIETPMVEMMVKTGDFSREAGTALAPMGQVVWRKWWKPEKMHRMPDRVAGF